MANLSKILYLVTQDDLGGAQKYALALASAFRGRAEVALAAGPDGNGWLSAEAARRGLKFIKIPELRRPVRPLEDFSALLAIRKLVAGGEWDLIHVGSSKAGVLASFATVGLKRRARVAYTAHGWVMNEPMSALPKFFFFILEWLAARCRDATIVLGESEAALALKKLGLSRDKVFLIPNGIIAAEWPTLLPREEARRKLGLSESGLVFGAVANFYKTKGLDILIAAWNKARLAAKLAILAASGPEKEKIEKLAAESPARENIILNGTLTNAAEYLNAFDAFVLPSRKEGLPFALLEAIAAGLPLIAADVGAVKETVGDSGLVFEPQNADRLAEALNNFANGPELRNHLRVKAEALKPKAFELGARMIEETWQAYEF